jgi:Flp pilus assembly protein TadG
MVRHAGPKRTVASVPDLTMARRLLFWKHIKSWSTTPPTTSSASLDIILAHDLLLAHAVDNVRRTAEAYVRKSDGMI